MKYTHTRKADLPFRWPNPPFQVALVEPEIPPNTGNIARLCVATGTPLHLVEPLGFDLTDAALRRAGLDYWESVQVSLHHDIDVFFQEIAPSRFFLFSTMGPRNYLSTRFKPGDVFVFGKETRGLPEEVLAAHPRRVLGIPMHIDQVRSLNLATAVSIVLYEALRQVQPTASPG